MRFCLDFQSDPQDIATFGTDVYIKGYTLGGLRGLDRQSSVDHQNVSSDETGRFTR